MKLVRYCIRGVEEIAKELGIVKSVVKPRRIEEPKPGMAKDILRYLKTKYSYRGIALFDKNGSLVASTLGEEEAHRLYNLIQPLLEDSEGKYVFLKSKNLWISGYDRRGTLYIVISSFIPDIIDLWILGREFERYMWGSSWED